MKNFDEKKMLMFLIDIALIFVEIEVQLLHYFANFFNITTGLFCPGDINKEAFFKLLSMSINIEQRHKEMGMLNEYEI